MEARWLSLKALAEYLGMSPATIHKLEERGLLPKPTGPTLRLMRYDRIAVDTAMRNALVVMGNEEARIGTIDDAVRRMADGIAQGSAQRPKAARRRA